MTTNSGAEVRHEPIVKPAKRNSGVSSDLLWKDRIKKEVAAANKKLHLAPNTVCRNQTDDEKDNIGEESKNRLGFTYVGWEHYPDVLKRREDKSQTTAASDLDISVPQTSAKFIGWLVNHSSFQYEMDRKEKEFHPRRSIYKSLHWPIHKGF